MLSLNQLFLLTILGPLNEGKKLNLRLKFFWYLFIFVELCKTEALVKNDVEYDV